MSDIKLGDAVEVAQWPCCGYKIGQQFRVNAMERPPSGFLRCANCGTRHPSNMDALGPRADWIPVSWLLRIEQKAGIKEGTRLG